ncbi:MAG: hypothetical protein HYR85_08010 [Planctomycetes bacterium]|nr:hypothetical protein [Planctomycetota bacterium]
MDAELQEDWARLRDAALAELRRPAAVRGFVRRVTAVVEPAFADAHRTDLFVARDGSSALARRGAWRLGVDVAKFRNPAERLRHPRALRPTIESADAPVAAAVVRELLDAARRIRVPSAAAETRIQLDGIRHHLEIEGGLESSAFTWGSHPPPGWEDLDAFLARVVDIVPL